jgi:hypothetical protein
MVLIRLKTIDRLLAVVAITQKQSQRSCWSNMNADTLTNLRAQEKILLRSMKDYARALAKVRKLIKTEQKALHKKEGADESNNT